MDNDVEIVIKDGNFLKSVGLNHHLRSSLKVRMLVKGTRLLFRRKVAKLG